MTVDVERKLLKWGNGYGIRLTAAEVARLGVQAGSVVHAAIEAPGGIRNDLSKLALFHFGGKPIDIKAVVEEEIYRDYLRSVPRRTRRKP